MQQKIKWHIGCSGFQYNEWKNLFYPPKMAKKQWFAFYCRHFNTLELNVTFYRFPAVQSLENWYHQSPIRFLFSVKAPRLITHYKKFNKTGRLLADFYTTAQNGLREKLGNILFQLPPQLVFKEQTLAAIIEQLDPAFNNVIEFRHRSWWNPVVFQKLSHHHIIFCSISHPQLPDDIVTTSKTLYYRFHGVPNIYQSAYSYYFLKKTGDAIAKNKKIQQACLYFNNTANAAAVKNALYLQKKFAG